MIAIDLQGRESASLATRRMETPKVLPLNSYYKSSKDSRFLNEKWRFGGGITPPDKSSTKCAPQRLRGLFFCRKTCEACWTSKVVQGRLNTRSDSSSPNRAVCADTRTGRAPYKHQHATSREIRRANEICIEEPKVNSHKQLEGV